ncbi:MAG: type II toxin-antitoxin system VapC family toxin [Planctomycetes bacterium]|nr:type II toxin-antitoxin system VapC family toxin [Planctomycetota bacterium]
MKLIDLNILLYAVNSDAAHHTRVRAWWENALDGQEPIGLAWVVLLGFLRLATSPRVFVTPLTPADAMARVDAWLGHENTRVVTEPEEHWGLLQELLLEAGTAGNLTTDAHLASLAIAHGATLVSCDADFGRFAQLRWENPTAGQP